MPSKTQATIDMINVAHAAGVEVSLPAEGADFWLTAAAKQRGDDAGQRGDDAG